MSIVHDLIAPSLAHPEQHLKFILFFFQSHFFNEGVRTINERIVMRCNTDIRTAFKNNLQEF